MPAPEATHSETTSIAPSTARSTTGLDNFPVPQVNNGNGVPSQMQKALELGSYFLSGCMAVNISQFLAAPLYLVNQDWYHAWIALTKQSFGLLTTTLTQYWAPTLVRVSGDRSVRGQLKASKAGGLRCGFPKRMVLMANHQIYTDWLYLWWLAYCNGMHGHIYIILKESLRRIPVIGWGMRLSQFIFLKRNWEQDKSQMAENFQKLNKATLPMWLMIFPEGTNLADSTRESSAKWAQKTGIEDLQHVLLPRSTGLRFTLQQMRRTVKYVYDCTIAYEGVSRGQYAQDIFTVRAAYFEGKPPKSVNMYWRRFAISSIPIDDPVAFEIWLRARWMEKDGLIEAYHRHGRFPADRGAHKTPDGKIVRGPGHIESQIRSNNWYEFLQIFAPVGVLALVLYAFYNALPSSYIKSLNKDNVVKSAQEIQKTQASLQRRQLGVQSASGTSTPSDSVPARAMTIYTGLSQNPAVQKFVQLPELTSNGLQQVLRTHQPAIDSMLTQKNSLQDLKSKLPPHAFLPFLDQSSQTIGQPASENPRSRNVQRKSKKATTARAVKPHGSNSNTNAAGVLEEQVQNQAPKKQARKKLESANSNITKPRNASVMSRQSAGSETKAILAQKPPQRAPQKAPRQTAQAQKGPQKPPPSSAGSKAQLATKPMAPKLQNPKTQASSTSAPKLPPKSLPTGSKSGPSPKPVK